MGRKSISDKFLRRSARGSQRTTARRRRLPLHLEQLEQRLLMDGDTNLAPFAADDDVMQSQPVLVQPISSALLLTIARPNLAMDFIDLSTPAQKPPHPVPEKGFQSEEDLRNWLVDAVDAQYGHLFDTSHNDNDWPWYRFSACDEGISVAASFSTLNRNAIGTSSLLDSFSGTNVQVEGVDEADLIETDGKNLYLVTGNELVIVDAPDGENLSIASRVRLNDRPTGIYLSGDRLTLISSGDSSAKPLGTIQLVSAGSWASRNTDFHVATTTITVLDLSDRTAPSLVQRTELHGSLVASRMVDGQLRLVLSHQRFHLPQPKILGTDNDEAGRRGYSYETRDEYLDRVLDASVGSLLPTYRTFSVDGEVLEENRLVQPNDRHISDSLNGFTRTTIATFDVLSNDAGPADTKTLSSGGATEVYSTRDSLYVFGRSNDYDAPESTIWKFDFDVDDHSIQLAAKGKVAGVLLNQFSADEHDGYLRLVTSGRSWNSGHGLQVLEQVGRQFKVVGSVDGLAPRERLHSVRFLGNRAFVVTFQKVDPLFAIDLSDPTNPTVAGELKIPGYSDYLQPIDENHLLGIGRGAEASIGLFQEMQISIFDVSELNDPQLAHRYSFDGGRSTASIATGGRWTQGDGDHHAVSYFPSEQILAIPIHSADPRGRFLARIDNTPIVGDQEGGLQIFSIDVATGFESLALIEHDSPIVRSLRIGDALLAFSPGEISSHAIADPATELDSLQLLVGSDVGLVELAAHEARPSVVDLQDIASRLLTELSIDVRGFTTADESLDTTPLAISEITLPDFFTDPFALPYRTEKATDSAFATVGSADSHDRRLEFDDALLDAWVHDPLGLGAF